MEYPKGLKGQHSNSYIMPYSTDLFCHSLLNFKKSNFKKIFMAPFDGCVLTV